VLPLALLGLLLAASAGAAWAFSDGRDLAGIYLVAVALVALRAEQRIAIASVT